MRLGIRQTVAGRWLNQTADDNVIDVGLRAIQKLTRKEPSNENLAMPGCGL